jgi:hypothetical protein
MTSVTTICRLGSWALHILKKTDGKWQGFLTEMTLVAGLFVAALLMSG